MKQLALLFVLALVVGCGSTDASTGAAASGASSSSGSMLDPNTVEITGDFTIPANSEKYVCYTSDAADELAIDRVQYQQTQGVHHVLLVTPIAREQDGQFECDVLIKQTWVPVFANGTGTNDLKTPDGSAFKIKKGAQILLQLHLLNASAQEIKGTARVDLHKSSQTGLVSAGIYAFGTQVIDLPANKATTITNDCAMDKDVKMFAGFPHMHQLGKKMAFFAGKDAASMTKQFSIDSWSFGEQAIYPMPLSLHKGDATRLECTYDNTTSKDVTFGEHTANEMCYFITFIAPYDALDGCVRLQ